MDCRTTCELYDQEDKRCAYGYEGSDRCMHSEEIPYPTGPTCERCGKEMDFDPETRIYSCHCKPCSSCEHLGFTECSNCRHNISLHDNYKKKNTTFYLHVFGDFKLPTPPEKFLKQLNALESGFSDEVKEWLNQCLASEINRRSPKELFTLFVKLTPM